MATSTCPLASLPQTVLPSLALETLLSQQLRRELSAFWGFPENFFFWQKSFKSQQKCVRCPAVILRGDSRSVGV